MKTLVLLAAMILAAVSANAQTSTPISVIAIHFGTTALTLSSTAPADGDCLVRSGTTVAGATCAAASPQSYAFLPNTMFLDTTTGQNWSSDSAPGRELAWGLVSDTKVTFSSICVDVKQADATTTDFYAIGLLDAIGNMTAHIAPANFTSTGIVCNAIVEGTATISPGKVIVVATTNCTGTPTACANFYSPVSNAEITYMNQANLSATTGGALNTTQQTLPADSLKDVSLFPLLILHN